MRQHPERADLHGSALASDAEAGVFDDLGWWLSGGASLLLWTGLALLLTA